MQIKAEHRAGFDWMAAKTGQKVDDLAQQAVDAVGATYTAQLTQEWAASLLLAAKADPAMHATIIEAAAKVASEVVP